MSKIDDASTEIRELTIEEVGVVSGARNSFWQAVMDGFENACTVYYSGKMGPNWVSCSGDAKP